MCCAGSEDEGIVMLVVTRYRVSREDASAFRDDAREALRVLAAQPGWQAGHIGRAVDDPTLWVLSSEWRDVGSYRRALSSYEVKVRAVPLLSRAIDEPSAFEVLTVADAGARAADADDVRLGQAAAPVVLTDFELTGLESGEDIAAGGWKPMSGDR